ncbi:carbohydrate ABC transporter permease [Streptococcus pneumoniae]|uniref:carbohydrate ABC transporter permease n=1 Tax=Streptococcus pneumoniae TaxID=1313 RepID=UPI0005E8A912|nr:sugar ABC transporter permease [Streptococcus pneumoniae]CIW54986.1 ABC transporter permease SP1689 [Streptococcus pneumoniae]COB75575.1 ABC transporter permease SP1689 [Streptococcus pneumoniae]
MVKERNLTRWIFVLPAMIIVGLLFVYPFFSSIFYSFTNKHLIMPNYKFVGLANYKAVLSDPNFFNTFFNSIKWTVFSLVGQVLVGFVLALALHRVRHFKKLYRTLLIVPWAFPTIVIAFSWQWILNGVYGYLPNLIVKLGLMEHTPAFLTDSTWAFLCLVFINIWFGAPMIMVNVLSALQTVPEEQFEAAKIDGANKFVTFYKVVLPIVAPGIVATAIYTFINAWNEFLYALILINNTGKMTVAVALRSLNGSEILDWGDMMAASVIVVPPSIIFFSIIQNKIASGLSEGSVK